MKKCYKIEIKKGLSVINILLIIILCLIMLFIGCIEYLRMQDGEYKEVDTDLHDPNTTWYGEELISIPL